MKISTPETDRANRRPAFSPLLSAARQRDFTARHHLTARELEIVERVSCGLSNRSMCDELCVSHATLRSHLRSVYFKSGCKNRVELILLIVHLYLHERPVLEQIHEPKLASRDQ